MATRDEIRFRKEKKSELVQALPKIFDERTDAEFALSLLRDAFSFLKIEDPKDIRFPIVFSPGNLAFGILIGENKWPILEFRKTKYHPSVMINIAMRADLAGADESYIYLKPDRYDHEYDIRIYKLPFNLVRHNKDEIYKNFEVVFKHFGTKYKKPMSIPTNPNREQEEKKATQDLFLKICSDQTELTEVLQGFGEEIVKKPADYPITQCSADTGFDIQTLEKWIRAIERKGQAIFYGPPGTGKTYIAEHLARHLIGGGEGFQDVVQLHPAYSYEDFIQGIRPQTRKDGKLDYHIVPGRFLEFCIEARNHKGKCVLIVDEINRADLARVFGELMYLLEYRDKEVPLAGSGKFKIPSNVLIIGTMNTADRSIALVDHALRRRFAFLHLRPNYEVLRRYHKKTGFPIEGLIYVLNRINEEINDPHYEIGISFFFRENLSEDIEDIWRMEIEPYLEEYYFDHLENAEKFRWDNVRSKIIE